METDEEISIQVSRILDGKGNKSQPRQRLFVKSEKGMILNGKDMGDYRAFIHIKHKAPEECKKNGRNVGIYNSCGIGPEQPGFPERENGRQNFGIVCDKWEGGIHAKFCVEETLLVHDIHSDLYVEWNHRNKRIIKQNIKT